MVLAAAGAIGPACDTGGAPTSLARRVRLLVRSATSRGSGSLTQLALAATLGALASPSVDAAGQASGGGGHYPGGTPQSTVDRGGDHTPTAIWGNRVKSSDSRYFTGRENTDTSLPSSAATRWAVSTVRFLIISRCCLFFTVVVGEMLRAQPGSQVVIDITSFSGIGVWLSKI